MKTARQGPQSIDEYIAGFPHDVQLLLQQLRTIIKRIAPNAAEAIRYQIPTFVLNGNLVHFAAFKNHIGFYPTPSGIEAFKEELAPYESAKGSVKFPVDKPIPFDLIADIVRFRATETRARSTARKRIR